MNKEIHPHQGRARSLAIRAWPLRFKVALAIAIPLLLAATLGALQVRSDLNEATNSSQSAKQVTVLPPAVAYLTAAEKAMVAAQDTSSASQADLDAALRDINKAADQLAQVRDTADLTTDQADQLDALLDLSRAIREADTETLSPGTWTAQLRQLQSGVTQLITTIVNAQIDPEPRLELLSQTLAGRFSLAMQQALVATERTGDTGSLELFAELGVEGAAIDRLASGLGDSEPAIAALRTGNADRSRTVRTGGSNLGGQEAYAEYDAIIENLTNGIDDQLATSASDARRSAWISGGIVAGALLATILLALLVSRLLLNPIRKVREGARAVAHKALPDAVARIRAGADPGPITPIDVTTHEEVGQLARAVDELHRQAVTLAAGEARLKSQVSEMFITLSRRNTSLINQQLGFIEMLEKDEEDPQRLESLFRLDHLAARMRRTADSLLVLADAPTRASAADDLTVASALHAATAGVQDYRRARVGSGSDARLKDAAAADVIHLLTELVDNALAYSAPTTTVQLTSRAAPNGVRVEIEDAGLGIPDPALADLNETLHKGGDVTPETARRMGLFVVSRLAERHGIDVSLERNDRGGTTAVVLLPGAVLNVAPPSEPTPAPAEALRTAGLPPQRSETPASTGPPTLQERLDAAMGLPRRRPGAQVPNASMPPSEPEPALEAEPPSELERPAELEIPAQAVAELDTMPPPTARSLDPDVGARPVSSSIAYAEAGNDTPIYKALRSAWLSTHAAEATWASSEVEAGWEQADRVAASLTDAPVNAAGLPMRRPGTRLMPGGVTKPATRAARDPEAIRARLASHAAGVSRGRATAAHPDEPPSEDRPV